MTPISCTISPASRSALAMPRRIALGHHDDHAEAAVEGAQHVVGRHAADLAQPAEDRRRRPLPGIEARARPVGQAARHVAGQPAAGDMGEPLDGAGRSHDAPAPASRRCASAQAAPRPAMSWRRAPARRRRGRCVRRRCGPANSRWNARRSRRCPAPRRPAAMSARGSSSSRSAAPTEKPARS